MAPVDRQAYAVDHNCHDRQYGFERIHLIDLKIIPILPLQNVETGFLPFGLPLGLKMMRFSALRIMQDMAIHLLEFLSCQLRIHLDFLF